MNNISENKHIKHYSPGSLFKKGPLQNITLSIYIYVYFRMPHILANLFKSISHTKSKRYVYIMFSE